MSTKEIAGPARARWHPAALLVFVVALLAGCAVQLAPPYDKAVVDGLNETSPQVMTMFASISNGADKNTFASREPTYNALIGKLDALAIIAGARPMPKNRVTDAINQVLGKRDGMTLEDDDATPPSAHAIQKISETLTKARDTDRQQGLTAYEAIALKRMAVIYYDQAVTYENFLQR